MNSVNVDEVVGQNDALPETWIIADVPKDYRVHWLPTTVTTGLRDRFRNGSTEHEPGVSCEASHLNGALVMVDA